VYCVDHSEDLYSTVVQVWPRYILINRCQKELHIRQCLGQRIIKVPVNGRIPVDFENKNKAQLIQIRLEDPDIDWMYS
jgi:hypothetical protein